MCSTSSTSIKEYDLPVFPEEKRISCYEKVEEYRADIGLISGVIVCLVLGILATVGVLNGMGLPQAAYFSWGMYAGAALFLVAEAIKLMINCRETQKTQEEQVTDDEEIDASIRAEFEAKQAEIEAINSRVEKFVISAACARGCTHLCCITFRDGVKVKRVLTKEEVSVLISPIEHKKIKYDLPGLSDSSIGYHFQFGPSKLKPMDILDRLRNGE